MPDEQLLAYARLQLHIAMPTLEDAWLDGYESVQTQKDEPANPYPDDSIEYHHWQDGWWAGFYNEPPLFTLAGEINPSAHLMRGSLTKRVSSFMVSKQVRYWAHSIIQLLVAFAASIVMYQLSDFVV